jgi:hypothetical protein
MRKVFAPARLLAALASALLGVSPVLSKPLREPTPNGQAAFISLLPKANLKLTQPLGRGHEGNDLAEVPLGERYFGTKAFKVENCLIHLGGARLDNKPLSVEGIKVGRKFARLNLLQGTLFGGEGKPGDPNFTADGTLIGEYRVHYDDKTTAVIPIIYGQDVRDWHNRDDTKAVTRGALGWKGSSPFARQFNTSLRLFVSSWENPHPRKLITTIDFRSANTICAPFCVAMSGE